MSLANLLLVAVRGPARVLAMVTRLLGAASVAVYEHRTVLAAVAVFVFAAGAASACGDDDYGGGGGTVAKPTATKASSGGVPSNLLKISVSDNKFSPSELQVPVGANVTWEWSGQNPHQVVGTFDGQEISSVRLTGGGVFLQAFQKAGIFEYHCSVHGDAMKGKVTIQ